jgi:hypothetical protein
MQLKKTLRDDSSRVDEETIGDAKALLAKIDCSKNASLFVGHLETTDAKRTVAEGKKYPNILGPLRSLVGALKAHSPDAPVNYFIGTQDDM